MVGFGLQHQPRVYANPITPHTNVARSVDFEPLAETIALILVETQVSNNAYNDGRSHLHYIADLTFTILANCHQRRIWLLINNLYWKIIWNHLSLLQNSIYCMPVLETIRQLSSTEQPQIPVWAKAKILKPKPPWAPTRALLVANPKHASSLMKKSTNRSGITLFF